MKVGEVPINVPLHIHGQGYADVNFIIPEVVRSIRVLEGPYDPRQGDSAIVGQRALRPRRPRAGLPAQDDLRLVRPGADRRDRRAEGGERRDVRGVLAARDAGLRRGPRVEVGVGQRAVRRGPDRRAITCASSRPPTPRAAALPGVVRQDDVNAGRIGYYDAYPYFNSYFPDELQLGLVRPARAGRPGGAGHRRRGARPRDGRRRALRDRALGHVDQLPLAPELHGRPRQLEPPAAAREPRRPLAAHERRDRVRASTARFHTAPLRVGELRRGRDRARRLAPRPATPTRARTSSNPADLDPWDYRESYGLDTVDLAGYLDLDVRLWKKLRISGRRARGLPRRLDHEQPGGRRAAHPGGRAARARSRTSPGVAPGPRGDRGVRDHAGAHAGRLGGRGLPVARRGEPHAVQRAHRRADRRAELRRCRHARRARPTRR